ncbi:hypothetical protein BJV82DRAFT_573317 [Fennellomyces sp. T-0311]|nr:hypothetical protein BJV82DRAFT_573317 [Fennellomyces sp. T-0311]
MRNEASLLHDFTWYAGWATMHLEAAIRICTNTVLAEQSVLDPQKVRSRVVTEVNGLLPEYRTITMRDPQSHTSIMHLERPENGIVKITNGIIHQITDFTWYAGWATMHLEAAIRICTNTVLAEQSVLDPQKVRSRVVTEVNGLLPEYRTITMRDPQSHTSIMHLERPENGIVKITNGLYLISSATAVPCSVLTDTYITVKPRFLHKRFFLGNVVQKLWVCKNWGELAEKLSGLSKVFDANRGSPKLWLILHPTIGWNQNSPFAWCAATLEIL